jgi:phosphoribosylaminoimidazole-succinocarboxamide synthase
MTAAVVEALIPGLPLFRRGKVRDTFRVSHPDGDRLLLVASDRLSAFDVVLPTPIPGKGILLTQLSAFWFNTTRHIVPNHLLSTDVADFPPAAQAMADQLAGRTMLTRLAERIDIECVVRGYLAGTGWADYRRTGAVCGHALPPGLRESERLPEPLFTPAGKNDTGHDENISVAEMERRVGVDLTRRLADLSRQLYDFAAAHALARGIIIADTKFEFGLLDGAVILIDEALTPDSSRFWEADQYAPGRAQPSLDKQFVRDWLNASGWNKEPPGPELPPDVVEGTLARYRSAVERLTQGG